MPDHCIQEGAIARLQESHEHLERSVNEHHATLYDGNGRRKNLIAKVEDMWSEHEDRKTFWKSLRLRLAVALCVQMIASVGTMAAVAWALLVKGVTP